MISFSSNNNTTNYGSRPLPAASRSIKRQTVEDSNAGVHIFADDAALDESASTQKALNLLERCHPLVPLDHDAVRQREELGRVADEVALEAFDIHFKEVDAAVA